MFEETIIKTLKYFDVQDHPLTLMGLWGLLLRAEGDPAQGYSVSEVQAALEKMSDRVEVFNGFYFLRGRKEIAEKRWLNNYYSTPRLRKAVKYGRFLRHIPFVSGVALSGSEALNNSKEGSDIDLLVLTEKNRIWLARLFITFYFQILGVRRHGNLVQNRFCLNHYVEKNKKISNDQNLYTAIEYISLIPLFGADEIYKFQSENLAWIKNYLLQPSITKYKTAPSSVFKKSLEWTLSGSVGNLLEKALGKIQMNKIKTEDYITVEKDELSFHPGSKAQQVLAKIRG